MKKLVEKYQGESYFITHSAVFETKWQKNSGTGSYSGAGTYKDVEVGPYQPLADELNLFQIEGEDKTHQIGGPSTPTWTEFYRILNPNALK